MTSFSFPDSFLWGAATSSHQIEGSNILNDWYHAEQSELIPPAGVAANSYEHSHEDVKLLKQINANAYRFSLEWSRIQPTPDTIDDKALAYYRNILQCLKENNIEPIVTLNHFTVPQWFIERGGWLHRRSMEQFICYVDIVMEAFAEFNIKHWITINEPMVYAFNSYMIGIWPPFETHLSKAFLVIEHLKRAHKYAYHTVKEHFPNSSVSFAKHYRWFHPCQCGSKFLNRISCGIRDFLFNVDFFDYAMITRTMDYIALNFYTGEFVKFTKESMLGDACHCRMDDFWCNSLGWFVVPEEFTRSLKRLSIFRKPIIITENGTTEHNDEDYSQFIHEHISAMAKAILQGVDIRGYMYWSLLDNYEWAEGYNANFGLFTQDRHAKPAAKYYSDICKNNSITI